MHGKIIGFVFNADTFPEYRPNIDLTAVAGAAISVHCHIVVSVRPSRRSGTCRWNLSGFPGSCMKGRGGGFGSGRRVACAV